MVSFSIFVIAAYLAVLVFALINRGQTVSHPWLFLLRGFFPSWRFFDAPGSQPRLFVRVMGDDDQWSQGSLFIPRAPFRFRDLFYNSENNLRLAEQTLVDHLSLDLHTLSGDQSAESLISASPARSSPR